MKKDFNKYNTKVRIAISESYRDCGKRLSEVNKKYFTIVERLKYEKDTLPYSQYESLKAESMFLESVIEKLEIERNVWDKAREICLNVADETL